MALDIALILIDRIGVYVFAISGGILAVRKDMDLLGVIVLAFLPAIGGGTLRDLILDQPVFWLSDSTTLLVALAGGLTAFLGHRVLELFRPLRWADAVGMAVFAVTGAAKALSLGHGLLIVLIMGAMTASAGGLLRDVVANEEPLILKKGEVYATAALLGAGVYYGAVALQLAPDMELLAGIAAGFALRAAGIVFGLSLPRSPF